ncbi:hypothetical protein D3C81_748770 [compost metagenome]
MPIAMRPTGRFTQKIYSQPKLDTMTPPRLGPAILPRETKVPISPSAFPRSLAGKISVTIPWLLAIVIDAPSACRRRDPTRSGKLKLKPHSSEPTVKITIPHLKTLIFPTISPSFPKKRMAAQIIIKYAVTTHSAWATLSFISLEITGKAMLTILPSRVDIKVNKFSTIRISQRFRWMSGSS